MNQADYERFKLLKQKGRRSEAVAAITDFIGSIANLEDATTWTRWYLENEYTEGKIRHELFEKVIFPVLLDGYQQRDPWSLRWLARTTQNLYTSKHLWQKVDCKTDGAFLADLLSICPDDSQTRAELLAWHLGQLRYCIHEWPAGILYGIDGATTAECGEILEEVKSARDLDSEKQYGVFFDEVETKVRAYLVRGLPQ